MNKELWDKIIGFDLDVPPGEYTFSTRLANENFWTRTFTQQAILEYKKFMYLAATSDLMVSPSEIIDVVWHQHLIFTQSYQHFCEVLGKQIQHLPSTHNKDAIDRFRQAKERTKDLYVIPFGEQPHTIWEYKGMYESLRLSKAKYKLRTIIIFAILVFLFLIVPSFCLLRPLYVTIDNPYFIIAFGCGAVFTFIILETFNRNALKKITETFDPGSFIYNLDPLELIYLKTGSLYDVINAPLNELIENGTIIVYEDRTLELSKYKSADSLEQLQAIDTLYELKRIDYSILIRQLASKPLFRNTANCMNAFTKYFSKSIKFANLFYLNFAAFSILLMLFLVRVITGNLRDKPITEIALATGCLTIAIMFFLYRLTHLFSTHTIPDLYKKQILPNRHHNITWQWTYFLIGRQALATSFFTIVNQSNANNNSTSTVGSSCGSSCGSSWSSCGGCGGGGD